MKDSFKKIAVLAGGPSCERAVSLVSGKAVYEALSGLGFSTVLMDTSDNLIADLRAQDVTMVFIALHGAYGEDGTVQRLLEQAEIPYTGPGFEMSQIAFDKSRTQALLRARGLLVPEFNVLEVGSAGSQRDFVKFPCVVKPAKAGSSCGITLVSDSAQLATAAQEAAGYSDVVLAEEYIRGRELTVGILGQEALPIVEIIPKRPFYDYQAKYQESGTRYEFPAKLTAFEANAVTAMALAAYRALDGEVMSRVDIILDEKGRPYVLELNTIPGLTGRSLLPKAAQAKGIDFPNLCVRILELSLASKRYGQTVKN